MSSLTIAHAKVETGCLGVVSPGFFEPWSVGYICSTRAPGRVAA
jgi:hypothetical protein